VKFANIQAVRFFAALSVLVFHLGNYAKMVFNMHDPFVELIAQPVFSAGVMVFFAVSGFVLTHSLQSTSVPQFLLLRVLRIYPAYWAAAAAVVVLHWCLGQPPILNMQFLKGLLLIPTGPGKVLYMLSVEWSLVFEIFFYAALSLLALTGRQRGILIGAAVWFAVCVARIAAKPSYFWQPFPTWSEIGLSPLNTPFLCGVFAYYLRHHTTALRLWAPVLVPVLLAGSYLTIRADLIVLTQGVAGGLLVAWAAAARHAPADHPLVRYGDFSYGVYLLHAPILLTLFTQNVARQWFTPSLALLVAAGSLALCAGLMYGCLEMAMYKRLRGWLVKPKRREHVETTATPLARAA
jgi:peptidoglycan/LPS O-acetylase OafA/YrhL